MKSITLSMISQDGEYQEITVQPSSRSPYELRVTREGHSEITYAGETLFSCLLDARRDLERDGLLLCCQGARWNVTTSGMQSQMTGGRFAYIFDAATHTIDEDPVDIFAPARLEDVTTVENQRKAIFDFFGIQDRQ